MQREAPGMSSAPIPAAASLTHPLMTSTERGRSSVHQNGSMTMNRAPGNASFSLVRSSIICASISTACKSQDEIVVEPYRDEHDVRAAIDHSARLITVSENGPAQVCGRRTGAESV